MIDQALFDYFTTRHFPREEVLNRLPFSVSIDDFWPQLLQQRKARAVQIPLMGLQNQTLWFVMTDSLMASGDRISSMARRDIDRIDPCDDMMTEGLMDEAFFTSFAEGAPISRLECRRFLKSGEDPSNVGELLAQNNLNAIRHMAEHRYEPYSSRLLLTFARLLTNALNAEAEEYRSSNTHLIPGRILSHCQFPPAADIPAMMDSLCAFLNDFEMHPLLKSAIAHAYILLVRPFDEGNERLARLIAYSVLLRKGYSFFRQFALSGMIAQDGLLYYQAMECVEDERSGGDVTYFLEYYLSMLSRSVTGFDAYLAEKRKEQEELKRPMPASQSHPGSSQAGTQQKLVVSTNVNQNSESPVQSESNESTYEVKGRKPRKDAKALVALSDCTTPESLLASIIKNEMNSTPVEDAYPYLQKFGLTHEMILTLLRNINTDISRRILVAYRIFRQNQDRQYTFSEIAYMLQVGKETTRRTCYVLTALRLIRRIDAPAAGTRNQLFRFFYSESLVA